MTQLSHVLKALFLACCLAVPALVFSQGTEQNNESLTRGRNNFNAGNFDAALKDIEDVVNSKNKDDRRDAYELQAEIYLATGERTKADAAMKNLLKIHWGYEADSRNPDLYHLYRSFRTDPVMYLSGRIGGNQTMVVPYANYGVGNTRVQEASFSDGYSSFQFGLGLTFALNRSLEVGTEVLFAKKDHEYYERINTGSIQQPSRAHEISLTENQTWIDVPVLATYTFRIFRRDGRRPWIFFPFVSAGVNFGFLQGARFESLKRVTTGGLETEEFIAEEPPVDILQGNSLRRKLNMSLIGSAGVRFPIKNDYLGLDFRYRFGFQNLVKAENRYARPDLIYKYGYIDDDMRLDNYAVSISYVWAIYIPKKKRAYQRPDYVPDPYPRWMDSVKVKDYREIKEGEEGEELSSEVKRYAVEDIEIILQNTIALLDSLEDLKAMEQLDTVLVRELEDLRRRKRALIEGRSETLEKKLDDLEKLISDEIRLLEKEKKRLRESLKKGHLEQIDAEIEQLKVILDDLKQRRKEVEPEKDKK